VDDAVWLNLWRGRDGALLASERAGPRADAAAEAAAGYPGLAYWRTLRLSPAADGPGWRAGLERLDGPR